MIPVLGWAIVLLGQVDSVAPASPVVSTAPANVLVVCHDDLLPGLRDWLRWRESQGYRLALVRCWQSKEEIREAIRKEAAGGQLRWVVLVGDAPSSSPASSTQAFLIPTAYRRAERIARFGPDREIASDNWYADLDDDGVPELALGRMSVTSAEELAALVAKTRRREEQRTGRWRSQIQLAAGAGGFGPIADWVIEWVAQRILVDQIPPEYVTHLTYADWRSPYCPDPRQFRSTLLQRWQQGCNFWVYMGHGQPDGLQPLVVPGGRYPTLNSADTRQMLAGGVPPIAVMLACYTGAFDWPEPCLAEALLRAPGGAACCISATRTTMPYGMAVLGGGMLHACFSQSDSTLGELVLTAKKRMVDDEPSENDPLYALRQWLDRLASALVPGATAEALRTERREHVALFHLLGDPLLQIRAPRKIAVATVATIEAGQRLTVDFEAPWAGRGTVELRCRRDMTKQPLTRRSQFRHDATWLGELQRQYELAQDQIWLEEQIQVYGGPQSVSFVVPPEAHGACLVRVVIPGVEDDAVGAAPLYVSRPSQPPETRRP
ncbi:MAG: peptidase C25 [Pirellulaceae bacterium]|nr:MAG: peptidase C25 [Pirellulaceae bacterium]